MFTIGTGFSGKLGAVKGGLKPAALNEQTVGQASTGDGGEAECKAGGSAGVIASNVTIPANTMVARFSPRDIDTGGFKAGGADNLDLFLFNSANVQVGYSGTVTSNEVVPAAGTDWRPRLRRIRGGSNAGDARAARKQHAALQHLLRVL